MDVSVAIYGWRAAREFPPQPVAEKVIRQFVDEAIEGSQCRQPTARLFTVGRKQGVANEHFRQGESIYGQNLARCARHRPFQHILNDMKLVDSAPAPSQVRSACRVEEAAEN
jgi:hypothetical protein